MEKIVYFDCFAGISGDMSVGAFIDAGIKIEYIEEELKKLNLEGYKVICEKKIKNGIAGTKFNVIIKEEEKKEVKNEEIAVEKSLIHNHLHIHHLHENSHTHHKHENKIKSSHIHRNLKDIVTIINSSELSKNIKTLAIKIFNIVAEAEGKIHGKSIEEVHFHEVGAIDSIVDIVAFAICIDFIKPDKIYSSKLNIGKGAVKCAHGVIPLPAPATLEILKGAKVYSSGINGETVTPTGAAIIKAVAEEYTDFPDMEIEQTGYGAGDSDFEIPNMLRIIIGKKKV
jgi:uncharacterized protein (TIGR00299 family) protein